MTFVISYPVNRPKELICRPWQRNHSRFETKDSVEGYVADLLPLPASPRAHRQMTHSNPDLDSQRLAPQGDCKYKIRFELASV